jgi:hypothetical protein
MCWRGKRAACWKSVTTDLKNAGAKFIDEAAVVDENMVTSRSPADLPTSAEKRLDFSQNTPNLTPDQFTDPFFALSGLERARL